MWSNTFDFIKTDHLHKQVQSGDSVITILQDVNLMINRGESAAIVGASGSGKTTLLTLLAGLDTPTSGGIFYGETEFSRLSEEQRAAVRRENIGFVFQSFQLLPALTALENVMLPLELQYVATQEAKKRAVEWLEKVGLGLRMNHLPTKLSGGEQQRVAIARAFVTNPAVIFADEMTGNLDQATGEAIANILFSLNKDKQTTLVLVTHDETLAARCQHRFHLQSGVLQPC